MFGVAEGTYSGDGTFSGANFSVKSTGRLNPGLNIGTLQFNSDVTFSPGSQIIAQVDPTNATQKADLVSSTGTLRKMNNATIVVQASTGSLTAKNIQQATIIL